MFIKSPFKKIFFQSGVMGMIFVGRLDLWDDFTAAFPIPLRKVIIKKSRYIISAVTSCF